MHAAIYNSFHSKTLNFSPCTSFLIWSVVHTHTHTPTTTWWLRAKARPQLQKKRKTKKREWPVVTIQFMQLAIITWQTNKGDNHLNWAESYGCKGFSTIRSGFQKLIHNAVRTHLIATKSTQMSSPAQNWLFYLRSIQPDLTPHYVSFIYLLVIALLCRWEWLGKGGRKDCIVSMWRIDHMSLLIGSLKSGLEWIPTRTLVDVPHLTFNVQ